MEKEKLNVLKQQFQSLSQQCQQFQSQCKELSEEELKEVTGGAREDVIVAILTGALISPVMGKIPGVGLNP